MEEIHAYRNDDGSYRVEMHGKTIIKKQHEYNTIRETNEAKIEIPRAEISVVAHSPTGHQDDVIFEFTVYDKGKQ